MTHAKPDRPTAGRCRKQMVNQSLPKSSNRCFERPRRAAILFVPPCFSVKSQRTPLLFGGFLSTFLCLFRRNDGAWGTEAGCMQYTDVAIVGGGLAGSTAAAMLG